MTSPDPRRTEIEAAASRWAVRLGGAPLSDAERRSLSAWLAESRDHRAAFEHAEAVLSELSRIGRAAKASPRRVVIRRRTRLYRLAAAAAVLLALTTGLLWVRDPLVMLAADFQSATGEARLVRLTDGSEVELSPASAIAVHFTGAERGIELLAGEAVFTVAPLGDGEARPFVVEANGARARALGTQFAVERVATGARVVVLEHRVEVAAPGGAEGGRVVLAPGQSVRYDRDGGLKAVAAADIGEATAWRDGYLVFDRIPLGEVADKLGRYRHGRIVIADSALASRQVSGVFRTSELDTALDVITRELGARTVSVFPLVTVVY
ncbi:FecR family protein [Zavarzinia compransoris]|uniref:FecR family protein n=1 Tax=Zavarzinia compransoris TaxID=1264899 RepID=UPI001AADE2E8|nr:FecR domain-containing protein [Zavarzinia compransoris]